MSLIRQKDWTNPCRWWHRQGGYHTNDSKYGHEQYILYWFKRKGFPQKGNYICNLLFECLRLLSGWKSHNSLVEYWIDLSKYSDLYLDMFFMGKVWEPIWNISPKGDLLLHGDSQSSSFALQVRNFREDWDLQVTQPVAGNYYPVRKSSHFQNETIYRSSVEQSNMYIKMLSFGLDNILGLLISNTLRLQVNLGLYIADGNYELSVLVDRAVGASSIQDGQLEIMLHRY